MGFTSGDHAWNGSSGISTTPSILKSTRTKPRRPPPRGRAWRRLPGPAPRAAGCWTFPAAGAACARRLEGRGYRVVGGDLSPMNLRRHQAGVPGPCGAPGPAEPALPGRLRRWRPLRLHQLGLLRHRRGEPAPAGGVRPGAEAGRRAGPGPGGPGVLPAGPGGHGPGTGTRWTASTRSGCA